MAQRKHEYHFGPGPKRIKSAAPLIRWLPREVTNGSEDQQMDDSCRTRGVLIAVSLDKLIREEQLLQEFIVDNRWLKAQILGWISEAVP